MWSGVWTVTCYDNNHTPPYVTLRNQVSWWNTLSTLLNSTLYLDGSQDCDKAVWVFFSCRRRFTIMKVVISQDKTCLSSAITWFSAWFSWSLSQVDFKQPLFYPPHRRAYRGLTGGLQRHPNTAALIFVLAQNNSRWCPLPPKISVAIPHVFLYPPPFSDF